MSVYNDERYLSQAIESILNQTYSNFEFIIINDGSTDNSLKIIKYYKNIDDRIKIINQKNLGLTKSLNKGIKIARGKYIARQDADDISCENRFQKQIKYFNNNINIQLLGTNSYIIDKDGKIIKKNKIIKSKDIKKYLFEKKNPFIHGSIMFRKKTFQNIGGYREKFVYSQDYDFLLRFAEKYPIDIYQNHLYKYRSHNLNISETKNQEQIRMSAFAYMFHKERKNNKNDSYNNINFNEDVKIDHKYFDYFIKKKIFTNFRHLNLKILKGDIKKTFKKNINFKYLLIYFISFLPKNILLKLRNALKTIESFLKSF